MTFSLANVTYLTTLALYEVRGFNFVTLTEHSLRTQLTISVRFCPSESVSSTLTLSGNSMVLEAVTKVKLILALVEDTFVNIGLAIFCTYFAIEGLV